MSVKKFQALISQNEICPILAEHILAFCVEHDSLFKDLEAIEGFKEFFEGLYKTSNTKYFDTHQSDLAEKFGIKQEAISQCFQALEDAVKVYILHSMAQLDSSDMLLAMDEFRKTARVAMKLKEMLPKKNSRELALLAMIDQLEKKQNLEFDEATNGAYTFFEHAEKVLDELIRIPLAIPNSGLGQFLKIGVQSAKGNMPLRTWVSAIYDIWTQTLLRDFKFDGKNGVNGRKRFLSFTFETISIIHPELAYNSVENSVTAFLSKNPKTVNN